MDKVRGKKEDDVGRREDGIQGGMASNMSLGDLNRGTQRDFNVPQNFGGGSRADGHQRETKGLHPRDLGRQSRSGLETP